VETLVSLAVLSAILLVSGLLFSSALRSYERAARDAEAASKLTAVSTILEGDLRDAVAVRASAGASASRGSEGGPLLELLCVKRPSDPRFEGELAVVRVSYRLEGSTLLRAERWIDGQRRSNSFEGTLSREVTHLSLRFSDGASWLDRWSPAEKGPLPDAAILSISLLLRSGAGSGNGTQVRRMSLEQMVVPTCKIGEWRKGS
jgi:type II secretory pathway component PulJ